MPARAKDLIGSLGDVNPPHLDHPKLLTLKDQNNKIYLVKSARKNNDGRDDDLSIYEERTENGGILARYYLWELCDTYPPVSTDSDKQELFTLMGSRLSQNLSLTEVSKASGISEELIQKYESGLAAPKGSGCGNLAKALGVEVFVVTQFFGI